MNNNKKQSNLQFTKLTSDDISTHEDIYIDMLVGSAHRPSGTYQHLYRDYVIAEVLKAKQMFHKTFK